MFKYLKILLMKNENAKKMEVTDEQAKDWIQKDLRAAAALLNVVLSNPNILDQVTEIIILECRDTSPLVDAIARNKERKEVENAD